MVTARATSSAWVISAASGPTRTCSAHHGAVVPMRTRRCCEVFPGAWVPSTTDASDSTGRGA
jgi:hypothetical protein